MIKGKEMETKVQTIQEASNVVLKRNKTKKLRKELHQIKKSLRQDKKNRNEIIYSYDFIWFPKNKEFG